MTSDDLAARHCVPCRGGEPPLDREAASKLLVHTPTWRLSDDGSAVTREFLFKDFHHTMAFVNAVAWIAHQEDHHPDLEVGYRRCQVVYRTHAVGGLTENDFICAARIDALFG